MERITESVSPYRHLERMDTETLLTNMNTEDRLVALAVSEAIPAIGRLVEAIYTRMHSGGRLFYLGAGTSGRLGVLDASELPPTFGVPSDWVIGMIAGGDRALRHPVEHAEDSETQAWQDLLVWEPDSGDLVVGIAASGTTPYVIQGLLACRERGIATGCITCNPGAPLLEAADYPVLAVVGPEFVTGSTRMKAGTAQKMILNMISTAVMIKLGRVVDNRMVDMMLSNEKLIDRGARMIAQAGGLGYEEARVLVVRYGSVRAALRAMGGS
jgi:N-acetylmuramic acid 6-phosphate etherase